MHKKQLRKKKEQEDEDQNFRILRLTLGINTY